MNKTGRKGDRVGRFEYDWEKRGQGRKVYIRMVEKGTGWEGLNKNGRKGDRV